MARPSTSRDDSLSSSINSKIVYECVRYILCREGSKIPIKQTDIKDHLKKTADLNASQFKIIIDEVNKVLYGVYGYKLMLINALPKQYIVLRAERCNTMEISTFINKQDRRLLIAALTHIFMSGTAVLEDDLWKFLIDAQLITDNDYEKKKLFKTVFTRQLYLRYTKREGFDEGEFDWGQRAEEEIPKMFLLEKVAEAFDSRPENWREQYQRAKKNDDDVPEEMNDDAE